MVKVLHSYVAIGIFILKRESAVKTDSEGAIKPEV